MSLPISVGDPTVAFLGCGNLVGSLLGGLIAAGYARDKFFLTAGNFRSAAERARLFGAKPVADNTTAVRQAELVVLGVKPKVAPAVLAEIAPHMQKERHLLVSLVAGLRLNTIQKFHPGAVVRAMPNLASRVGGGITALLASSDMSQKHSSLVKKFFTAFGKIVWVKDDKQMDIYTALCGSGPAYFYHFLNILTDNAKSLGLCETAAQIAVLRTGYGALDLIHKHGQTPKDYINEIAVPGGTTRAALDMLASSDFDKKLHAACRAAVQRAEAMSAEQEKEILSQ